MLRTYFIGKLTDSLNNKEVILAGWVHEVRELGNITFLILRDKTGLIQIIGKIDITDKSIIQQMHVPKESVIQVKGILKINKQAKRGFEIIPIEIINLNPISSKIPFEVTGKVYAELDTLLDFRYIDLRRLKTTAVFNIQSTILNSFRTSLIAKNFQEIRTPCIVKEATEGGADLFNIKYFERQAYLAQSPQLYKQLAVIGGLDKIFVISSVFRAEKSNTTFHLSEITQMDIEMGFADYNDVINILSQVFLDILKDIKNKNIRDQKILDLKLNIPKINIITYSEMLKKFNSNDIPMTFGDDLNRNLENEVYRLFGEAVIIKDFPSKIRAFYSMPNNQNPEICNSFDLIYRGLEISSGAQRIHDKNLLIQVLKNRKINVNNFNFYINAMACGAPPHSGWSIGLERLTMQIANLDNIRKCSLFPRDRKRLTL